MPLTLEEEQELKDIEATLGVQEETVVESSGLSSEEEQELTDIEGQLGRLDEISGTESAARGLAQGVTFGFADEITAGVESVVTDKSYKESRDESRQAYNAAREANPAIYTTAEIGGGIATSLASGGVGAGVKGAITLGALGGLGVSESESIEGIAKDTATGAALGLAGDRIMKGGGKLLKKVFSRSTPVGKEILGDIASEVPANYRFREASIKDITLGKFGTAEKWLVSDGAVDIAMSGVDEGVELLGSRIANEKSVLGQALKQVKYDIGDTRINVSEAVEGFSKTVGQLENSLGMNTKAGTFLQGNIIKPLKSGSFEIDGKKVNLSSLNIEEAHKIKQLINKVRFSKGDDGVLFKDSPDANNALRDLSDSLINAFNEADTTGTIRNINQKFAKIYDVEEFIPRDANDFANLLTSMATSGSAHKGRSLIMAAHGYSPELASELVGIANPRLKMFSAVSSFRNMDFGTGDVFRARAGMSLAGPLGGVAAVGKQGLQIAGHGIAKARQAFKFPRSVEGIFANAEISVSKLASINHAMALALNDAIVDKDVNKVEELMIQGMNSMPEEFEAGMGLEGKAVTPQEIQQVESQIRGSRMSLRQKRVMLSEFKASSMIPTPDSVPVDNRLNTAYNKKIRVNGRKVNDY